MLTPFAMIPNQASLENSPLSLFKFRTSKKRREVFQKTFDQTLLKIPSAQPGGQSRARARVGDMHAQERVQEGQETRLG